MRMYALQQAVFPKTAHHVRFELPRVLGKPSVVHAMRIAGGLDEDDFEEALRWGAGPTIEITRLSDALGEISPWCYSWELRVSIDLAWNFETAPLPRQSRGWYMLTATILQELAHWGDDQDYRDRKGEEGEELERLAFGSVLV